MSRIDAKATLARAERAERERDAAIAHLETVIREKVCLFDWLALLCVMLANKENAHV